MAEAGRGTAVGEGSSSSPEGTTRAAGGSTLPAERPKPEGHAPAGSGPVFIAGADRSGTTLLYALLASHPNVSMVRRTNMWRYFHRRYGDLADQANLDRCLRDMLRYRRMRHLQPDAERIRREFLAGEPTYGRLFALFHRHLAERRGKTRWGDKSLHTELYADRVFAEYPDARVVHMIRDPRDRYASVRKRHGEDRPRVGGSTGRWLISARAARRNAERHPDRYLVLRYEDLAADPEATMRRACRFIGEPFVPEILAMAGAPDHRDSGGNSSFADVDPTTISVKAIGRFRSVLSPTELRFIELVTRREMSAFGYARTGMRLPRRQAARFGALEFPIELAKLARGAIRTHLGVRRGAAIPWSRFDPEDAQAEEEDREG